jgi:hypothetical protein
MDSRCFKILKKHDFQIVEKLQTPEPADESSLPVAPPEAVWVEMTKTSHEHGGAGWEFATCLWSPSAGSDGRDTYSTMREAKPGDLVIHCNDSAFVGFSLVDQTFTELEEGPPRPGAWAGRDKYYRVDLRSYSPFVTPLPLAEFLKSFGDEIREDIEANAPQVSVHTRAIR